MQALACIAAQDDVWFPAMSREKLLDAALRVYEAHGFRGATTRRIAEEAGVNEITIFRLFGSKAALIDEALRREAEEVPPAWVRLPDVPADPERELTAWCAARLQQVRARRELILRTMSEAGSNPAVSCCGQAEHACAVAQLREYVERLDVHGFLHLRGSRAARAEQKDAAVAMLLAAIFTDAVSRDLLPHFHLSPERRALTLYVRLFLRALGLREAAERSNAHPASSAAVS